jgi:hypothetical protein
MTLNRPLLIAVALTNLSGTTALAQWPLDLMAGARVRVEVPEQQYQADTRRGHRLRGRVTALAADTLYLAVTDSLGPLAIPRTLVQRLDLSRGVPSRGMSALRRGFLVGAGCAVVALAISGLDDEPDGSDAEEAALIGGAVGFGTGALFGALFPHERWKRIRFGPAITPGAGTRLGLALATTF